jgi:hypothetical protein
MKKMNWLQLLDKLSTHDSDTLRSHDIEVQPRLHECKILGPTLVLPKPSKPKKKKEEVESHKTNTENICIYSMTQYQIPNKF